MAEVVYSRDQVERWNKKLEQIALLPRTTFTKKQVVEELIDSIEKALQTRSYEEVAKALAADGLDISAGSLKQYVSKYRRTHKTKPVATGRKRLAKEKKVAPKEGPSGQSAIKGAVNDLEPQETVASARKAKRFVEMAEDL